MNQGLMHVYYGDGKGKSTAAIGLAVRAAGYGRKVIFLQFLKGRPSGELAVFETLPNVLVLRGYGSAKFSFAMNSEELENARAQQDGHLRQALALDAAGDCDLLILDEAMDAFQLGLLDEALLRQVIFERQPGTELVITGHKPSDWILEASDYVSEMRKHKHPYDRGIKSREGIEF